MKNQWGKVKKKGNYVCQKCDKIFPKRVALNIHKAKAHKDNQKQPAKVIEKIKYTCDVCGILLSSKATLKLHVQNVHLRMEILKCDECDFSTTHPTSLRNHTKHWTCQEISTNN